MSAANPACPRCGSTRTLPFEKEQDYERDFSPEVAVYAGITLVTLAIGLFLFSVVYFRIILLLAALTVLFYLKKRKNRRPQRAHGNFVCLDCSHFFRC